MKNNIFLETLHNDLGQFIKINNILIKKKTKFQKIIICKNKFLGKILIINNIIQTTEYDEYIYHEMISLIPLLSNYDKNKNILIIGGGDGGCLKQLTKFSNINTIYLVEIDKQIIKYSKKHLFEIHNNSFNDPRVKIIYKNGFNFLKKNKIKFDIIIVDGTDPIDSGKILFTKNFYKLCKSNLTKQGIFVSQNGTFIQYKKNIIHINIFKKIFKYNGLYTANIPTYYGGNMFFIWGTKNNNIKNINKKYILKQIKNLKFKYYNYLIHKNCFILPQNIIYKLK